MVCYDFYIALKSLIHVQTGSKTRFTGCYKSSLKCILICSHEKCTIYYFADTKLTGNSAMILKCFFNKNI